MKKINVEKNKRNRHALNGLNKHDNLRELSVFRIAFVAFVLTISSGSSFAASVCVVEGQTYLCSDLERGIYQNGTGWDLGFGYGSEQAGEGPQPRLFLSNSYLPNQFNNFCQSLQAHYVQVLTGDSYPGDPKYGYTLCSTSYAIDDDGVNTSVNITPAGVVNSGLAACTISPIISYQGSSCFPGQTEAGVLRSNRLDICPIGFKNKADLNISDPQVPDCLKPLDACPIQWGNPITMAGEKRQTEKDYASANSALHITRYYNSARVPVASYSARSLLALGQSNPRWVFDYQQSLDISEGYVVARRPTGDLLAFPKLENTVSAINIPWVRMAHTASSWTIDFGNEIETYDSLGRLQSIVDYSGRKVTVDYDSTGRLKSASDDFGRSLTFSYVPVLESATETAVGSVSSSDGSIVTYQIGDRGQILTATLSDGVATTYGYVDATYSAVPLLSSIAIGGNPAYATFAYDHYSSVAVSTQHAGGVGNYAVTNSRGAQGAGIVSVTDPLGNVSSLKFISDSGTARLSYASQPAGSGCAAASNALTYDMNGNKASEDDFTGNRICYTSDLSRNVETNRVEGLGNTAICSSSTAINATLLVGARKTSTIWHPDWRLQSNVANPGRITSSVYNGQPDPFNGGVVASCAPASAVLPNGQPVAVLCKQVQQATTDADGHLGFAAALNTAVPNRVRSWTYNLNGQVLTEQDLLGNTTRSSYYSDTAFTGTDPQAVGHTVGDLMSVTNAVGQVTRYDSYDKSGNLLQSTDSNGVVTTNTYDLRQRLLSTTVGGQTTAYAYDPAGQLLTVTSPDASVVTYTYDPAHRLTAVADSLGNSVNYTLDPMGNRTAEVVKDPGGNLSRQASRAFDALNRQQQTTGL